MKVLFIINPVAGGKNRTKEINEVVREELRSEEGVFEIKTASDRRAVIELSDKAVKRGYSAVFACGGDGTIHDIAGPLVNSQTALGIIPCGSGNGFARALGVPLDNIRACVSIVKSKRTRDVDVGLIGDKFFFSTAGIGFDAYLSKKYNDGFLSKRLRGLAPYFPLAVFEFYRYAPLLLSMKVDNNLVTETPFILTFANTPYYGGTAVIAPGAMPDDGLLDICTVPKIGLFQAFMLARRLFNGTIESFSGYRRTRAGKVEINRQESVIAHADGEPFEWRGNLTIEMLPKGLRVLAG